MTQHVSKRDGTGSLLLPAGWGRAGRGKPECKLPAYIRNAPFTLFTPSGPDLLTPLSHANLTIWPMICAKRTSWPIIGHVTGLACAKGFAHAKGFSGSGPKTLRFGGDKSVYKLCEWSEQNREFIKNKTDWDK